MHGRRLLRLYEARYGRPDLIHVHSILNAGVIAKDIHDRHGIPFVLTEHFSGYARDIVRPRDLEIAKSVARAAGMRLGVSQPLCKILEEQLGATAGLWAEMPNIVDERFLKHPLHERLANDGPFRFISVASLTENKGHSDLLSAFAQKFQTDAQVTLDIGGVGVERQRLEALALHLGIQDQVRFLGALDRNEVVEAVAAADCFVLASRYETFGVVLIEALALGKPAIATRCGGPESIVREQDGLLVSVGDIDALANAMQEVRTNFAGYQAEKIRRSCASRFSAHAVVERLTSVYCQVLGRRKRGSMQQQMWA